MVSEKRDQIRPNNNSANLLVSALGRVESLSSQLEALQKHLEEVDSAIADLIKYSPAEVDSFWLVRRLIVRRIADVQNEIEKLQ